MMFQLPFPSSLEFCYGLLGCVEDDFAFSNLCIELAAAPARGIECEEQDILQALQFALKKDELSWLL